MLNCCCRLVVALKVSEPPVLWTPELTLKFTDNNNNASQTQGPPPVARHPVEPSIKRLRKYEYEIVMTATGLCIQVVYSTFERLWNLARETFAPVWSLSQVFPLKNSVIKSLQKTQFENIQNRRPHGSLIKHGGFWDFSMCRASADDQSPDIPFRIGWIWGNFIRPV